MVDACTCLILQNLLDVNKVADRRANLLTSKVDDLLIVLPADCGPPVVARRGAAQYFGHDDMGMAINNHRITSQVMAETYFPASACAMRSVSMPAIFASTSKIMEKS